MRASRSEAVGLCIGASLLTFASAARRYLDSIINLAYTLLRMLEKYSKSKAYMYVRKKRAGRAANARKKKREPPMRTPQTCLLS